jgi:hypothetical protein
MLLQLGQFRAAFSTVVGELMLSSTTESTSNVCLTPVINDAATLITERTTLVEEWPIALEFIDWASEDCVEFCNSHGLINYLRRCRKALNSTFSNIHKMIAELNYYQEIDTIDEGHIVIRLEIKSDRETYKKEYKSWVSWMVQNLRDESRMFISVSIDRL